MILDNKTMKDTLTVLCDRVIKLGGIKNDGLDNIVELNHNELKQLNDLSDEDLISTFDYFNSLSSDYTNYDVRFMRLAREFSTWSKDPKKQIGCVAVRDKQIISQGYNGFPRGIKDDWRIHVRSIKLPMVVHAELNMVINALNKGVSLQDSTAYIYGLPVCSDCVKPLIQSGVNRIVMCDSTDGNSKTWSFNSETFKLTRNMLDECDIGYSFISLNMLGV